MRLLVTGFQAFGSVTDNPSQRLALHSGALCPSSWSVCQRVLPVSWLQMPQQLLAAVESGPFDVALLLGVAAGSDGWRVEEVARNSARHMPDADGLPPPAKKLCEGGPDLLASTLHAASLAEALNRENHPACASQNAGEFLCNAALYHALQHGERLAERIGFLHVPSDASTHSSPVKHKVFTFEQQLAALHTVLQAL